MRSGQPLRLGGRPAWQGRDASRHVPSRLSCEFGQGSLGIGVTGLSCSFKPVLGLVGVWVIQSREQNTEAKLGIAVARRREWKQQRTGRFGLPWFNPESVINRSTGARKEGIHGSRLNRTTTDGPPATSTTKHSAPSATDSSASYVADCSTEPSTTNTPPRPTANKPSPNKPLDTRPSRGGQASEWKCVEHRSRRMASRGLATMRRVSTRDGRTRVVRGGRWQPGPPCARAREEYPPRGSVARGS